MSKQGKGMQKSEERALAQADPIFQPNPGEGGSDHVIKDTLFFILVRFFCDTVYLGRTNLRKEH